MESLGLKGLYEQYNLDTFGRAGLRKEVGLLRPGPRGPKVLRHQMVRWSAGGTEYPRWWHQQVGRQQFCWFLNLTNMPCSVLPWQAAWQVILISFKIIITLRRAQKNGVTRPYKNFIFLYNPFNPDFLIKFHIKSNDSKWSHWGWKGYTSSII